MSGRSVVKIDIPWGGVLAYTRGQMIDNEVVEANGWQDYVAGEGTKEGREVRADVSGLDVSAFETSKSSTSSRSAKTTTEQEG